MSKDSEMFTPELGNIQEEKKNDIGFNQVSELEVNEEVETNNTNNLETYYCQSCKTFYTSGSASAGKCCVFCRNTSLVKDDSFEYDSSTYVIPFSKSMDDAIKKYKRRIGFDLFLPSCFKSSEIANKIRKVYLPCVLYDLNVSGKVDFICADSVDKKTNKTSQSYDVSYTTNFDYNNLLVSDYKNFNEKMFNSINNYSFSNGDILGEKLIDAYYIKPDSVIDSLSEQLVKKAVNTAKGEIDHKLKKLKNNGITCNVISQKNYLVPVYLLKVNYNDSDYFYLMNGQTGKTYIELTVSVIKVILVTIVLFTIIFAITLLIAYIF